MKIMFVLSNNNEMITVTFYIEYVNLIKSWMLDFPAWRLYKRPSGSMKSEKLPEINTVYLYENTVIYQNITENELT
jgi:hypothetical protein